MTMLAVFLSRAQALDFVSYLKSNGIPAQAVATPREAGVGCGVSIKFEEPFYMRVVYFLRSGRYSTYSGIMKKVQNRFEYVKR